LIPKTDEVAAMSSISQEREPAPSRSYFDLHDQLDALDKAGLLLKVDIPINKDTEIHPLMRWQFRGGLDDNDRKAMLFTNVVDAKGKTYDIPVVIGAMGGSRRIYEIGIGHPLDQLSAAWTRAMGNLIAPRIVDRAHCQQIVIEGGQLDRPGGALDGLPVPISTPGWDNGPYLTTSAFITRDPDTGVQNLGNYRAQIKAPRRLGMNTSVELKAGGYLHWRKYKELGRPMPAAVVVGLPPAVAYASVQKAPETIDEISLAGALVSSPINVVKARTVDLMVPAEAEIVIEGLIDTEYLEPEAPFGESHGHVNLAEYNAFMDVTCITRKRDAIFTSFLSQLAPSESTVMRQPGQEAIFLRHLRDHIGIKGLMRVHMHMPLIGGYRVLALVFERGAPQTEVWRALHASVTIQRPSGKFVIAIDDDIDPNNADAILWAMTFRAKPHLDMQILPYREEGHGPRDKVRGAEDSSLLVNATLRQDYPPISLPKREYMERARVIWEQELKLPKLKPQAPWYGYDLGAWTDELEHQAKLAVRGDYWETGRIIAQRRRRDVAMNTEVRDVVDDDETPR
jgi:4-hydroxy-3-polyprenylbenzoate decarboxylase